MAETPSANDNRTSRRVRDGLISKWADADLAAIATDETLERLANARNESSATANRFMLFGALGAFLYLLKFEGIANELKFGDYSLAALPFGLFVTSAAGLILATVALIRIGDSRAFDRQLRLACERRYESGCHARYTVFPNATAFGEAFSLMASVIQAGTLMALVRFLALALITIFILGLIVSPAIAGIHYLYTGLYASEGGHDQVRWWLIFTLIITNLTTLILMLWTRLADEG
jgi:hypothetical protein